MGMEYSTPSSPKNRGSGGRTIGKLVAEHLGIQCYDAELIQKLAAESGFDESYVKEAGEYTPGGFLASAFTDRSFGPTNEDLLWKLQYRIIRELAEKEPCVIVGRCADFILQNRTDCLKVFVHADLKFRADRIVRVYGEREKSPEARLKEKDKRRAAYYRFYTDMKWGNAANYHIALDSGVIGIEKDELLEFFFKIKHFLAMYDCADEKYVIYCEHDDIPMERYSRYSGSLLSEVISPKTL